MSADTHTSVCIIVRSPPLHTQCLVLALGEPHGCVAVTII